MNKKVLLTYSNLDELRKYEKEIEIYSFILAENKGILNSIENAAIDITTIVIFLSANNGNVLSAEMSLYNLDDSCVAIVRESYAEIAINMFPYVFNKVKPIYEKKLKINKTAITKRSHFYTYKNEKYLKQIIKYTEDNEIPLASFPSVNGDLKACYDEFNKNNKLAIVDLTSLSLAIEDNKNILYLSEQFLSIYENVRYIVIANKADILLKYFPLYFDDFESVDNLLKGVEEETEPEDASQKKRCITDLDNKEFEDFCSYFDMNLIGHRAFKNKMFRFLKNFQIMNRVNDQKVFSMFLFGMSGIGKTEVARLIAEKLHHGSYLTKINFANYSSQDALNILIGSPRGYIGCEHGELSDKVGKSEIGLILCDEFEKTNRPVFSFFLELLEDGKFTDTMAREHDINGFIVIFTSNILSEAEFQKTIPPELQTRLDLVCEFKEPSVADKHDFLELLYNKAAKKYVAQFSDYNITIDDKKTLYNFSYQNLHALRDIKREFQNKLMELFEIREKFTQ
ncbi:chaperone protein ClpB [Clostridium ragsdalei P11]|uniref:Chaperone protein ClpB n=1 Tax=Clostridium ragsdalei P11 TaxID=1353534 RepID=A0A1A6AMY7_9CLOT|nr:AAA family ATPase [Clostridium ragsdalei]OBR91426.1 chaperone protein ClpB [Clostridium ragsdalei P11]